MKAERPSISEVVADFCCSFDSSRVNEDHLRTVARAIADTYAVCIAGSNEPAAVRTRHYVHGLLPDGDAGRKPGPGVARLWGRGVATSVEWAALVNGTAAHVLDFDDASSSMGGHPSVALLPALIALAEARDLGGHQLAASYVVGFDIASRLGQALKSTHYDRGWHMTATVGTIAAAAACAHLLGLEFGQVVSAIGLAVAQAGGTRQNFGFDAKSFQAGQCGAAALRAALLARRGFTASPLAMDGDAGYTSLYSESEDIFSELSALGSAPLEIDRAGVEIKKYPLCYAIHRPLDGIFRMARQFDLKLDDVESADVKTSYGALAPLIGRAPENGIEARFSMEYAIAAALEDGEIGLFSCTDDAVRRPRIQQFMRSVTASEAPGTITPRWAEISLRTKDGRLLSERVDSLHGGPGDPLSDEELAAKLSDCLKWGGGQIDAASLHDAVSRIGTESVRGILNAIERTPTH